MQSGRTRCSMMIEPRPPKRSRVRDAKPLCQASRITAFRIKSAAWTIPSPICIIRIIGGLFIKSCNVNVYIWLINEPPPHFRLLPLEPEMSLPPLKAKIVSAGLKQRQCGEGLGDDFFAGRRKRPTGSLLAIERQCRLSCRSALCGWTGRCSSCRWRSSREVRSASPSSPAGLTPIAISRRFRVPSNWPQRLRQALR